MKLVQCKCRKQTYDTVRTLIFQLCLEGCKGRLERVFRVHLFKVSDRLQCLGLHSRILTLNRSEKSLFSLCHVFSQ